MIKPPISNKTLNAIARGIFKKLDEDIKDRRGLKSIWATIDKDVMEGELKPAWENIFRSEVEKHLGARS